jgi:hypothetical protein
LVSQVQLQLVHSGSRLSSRNHSNTTLEEI